MNAEGHGEVGEALASTLGLGGTHDCRPPGSLTIAEPRELITGRSLSGAYGPDGVVARDTLRLMREIAWDIAGMPPRLEDEPVDVSDEDVIWGGPIVDHYGHFLVETPSRLWPLLEGGELEGLRVVFTKLPAPQYAEDWLEAFGLSVVELPAEGVVKFNRMHVAEPGWRLEGWIAPEVRDVHLRARRKLDVRRRHPRGVVWLSRSGLDTGRSAQDEALLEWVLGDHVVCVRPETLSLSEQIGLFESATGVAGVIGSAFHTALMADPVPPCLYLCPPWDRGSFPAQHRLLDADAAFKVAVRFPGGRPEARAYLLERIYAWSGFPKSYYISIPEALRAMGETVCPGLLDDPRMSAFADPEHVGAGPANDLDEAVCAVLCEPFSVDARRNLAAAFDRSSHPNLGAEQRSTAERLAAGNAPGGQAGGR